MIGFTIVVGVVSLLVVAIICGAALASDYFRYCSENKVGLYEPIKHKRDVLKQLNDMRLEIAKLNEEIKNLKSNTKL